MICRVVRAVRVRGRWAWIPGWGLRLFSQPPTFKLGIRYFGRILVSDLNNVRAFGRSVCFQKKNKEHVSVWQKIFCEDS